MHKCDFLAFPRLCVPVYIFIFILLLQSVLPPNVCIVLLSLFCLIIFHFWDILNWAIIFSPLSTLHCSFLKNICILNGLLFIYCIYYSTVWRDYRVPWKKNHHNIYALNTHIHVHISIFWKKPKCICYHGPQGSNNICRENLCSSRLWTGFLRATSRKHYPPPCSSICPLTSLWRPPSLSKLTSELDELV